MDELERKVSEGCLTQSCETGLIITRDHPVDLIYVLYFKLKHRQEIVSN